MTTQKFATVVDSIYRKARIYSHQYLGFVSLFTGEKETLNKWHARLRNVAVNNLIHGGYFVLKSFPIEYENKINKIMKGMRFEKIHDHVWKKPDITVKEIKKGINKYFW